MVEYTSNKGDMIKRIAAADALYKVIEKRFGYGTAGFRTLGDTLDRVCFRAGIMAGIRAKTHGGLAGVMVTASHNPKQDNGLKIFERDGEMLEAAWEKLAEDIVNTKDIAGFLSELGDKGAVEGGTFEGKVEGDIFST
jgi:phosphoglucomutase